MFNWITALIAAALFAAGCASGAVTMRHFDDGRYEKLVAHDAQAQADAEQEARDIEGLQTRLNAEATINEANQQARLAQKTLTLIRKVPVYVTAKADAVACIPWGVVRVLDAAVAGVDPATLPTPAGQPDDACSDVKASEASAILAEDIGAANQNAEQLNALEAHDRQQAAALNKEPPDATARP